MSIPRFDVRRTRTDAGSTVVTRSDPRASTAAFEVSLRGGSAIESRGQRGAAHVLEHLIVRGHGREGARRREWFDRLGADLRAHALKDQVRLGVRVPAEAGDSALQAVLAMIPQTRIGSDSFKSECLAVDVELSAMETDDIARTVLAVESAVFAGSALGRSAGGTRADIAHLTLNETQEFARRAVVPKRVVVAASGAVHHSRIAQIVARSVGQWPDPPTGEPAPAVTEGVVGDADFVTRHDLETVALGLRFPQPGSSNAVAMRVIDTMLTGGLESLLVRRLRKTDAIAYSLDSTFERYSRCACLIVYARTASGLANRALDGIRETLDKISNGEIQGEALVRAQQFLRSGILIARDDHKRVARSLCHAEIVDAAPSLGDAELDAISRVTFDDVVAAARSALAGGTFVARTLAARDEHVGGRIAPRTGR